MASANLSKTPGSAGNRKKFNFSFWIKGNDFVSDYIFFSASGSTESAIIFDSSSRLEFYEYNGSSKTTKITTKRKFRDPSAWYHIVVSIDTTQSTSTDRVKIYVNGSQETDLENTTYGAQDFDSLFNNTTTQYIGSTASGGNFDGSMTHIHFNDGYTYDPSYFGESDTTSGIWKPKPSPSVTYGSNGYFLKFENSGAMGTDSSGNSNTYAVGGTLTQNVDSPSNNFATLNPLQPNHVGVPTNGNLTYANPSSGQRHIPSTMAVSSGKWYVEVKCNVVGGDYPQVGIFDSDITFDSATYIGSTANGYGLSSTGHIWNSNSQQVNTGTTWTTGDILGIALDLTNDKIYWHKNGTYVSNGTGTGNPSTGTNGYSITADKTWYFTNSSNGSGGSPSFSFNFGSGYFGTTQVSSSNADANGHGLMEYAVPTGFYTLNTKNIKEFG